MSEHKIPIPSMIYNAAVGGHVTNSQQIIDENLNREQQDINEEVAGVPYNATTPNGMGRIVLKKNDNFKQVIEAQTDGNTIFIIKYDFTLTDNVNIPVNCILEFDGGSISGSYTITGTNTGIKAGLVKIFSTDVILDGTWCITECFVEWFGFVVDNSNYDLSLYVNKANQFKCDIKLVRGIYYTINPVEVGTGLIGQRKNIKQDNIAEDTPIIRKIVTSNNTDVVRIGGGFDNPSHLNDAAHRRASKLQNIRIEAVVDGNNSYSGCSGLVVGNTRFSVVRDVYIDLYKSGMINVSFDTRLSAAKNNDKTIEASFNRAIEFRGYCEISDFSNLVLMGIVGMYVNGSTGYMDVLKFNNIITIGSNNGYASFLSHGGVSEIQFNGSSINQYSFGFKIMAYAADISINGGRIEQGNTLKDTLVTPNKIYGTNFYFSNGEDVSDTEEAWNNHPAIFTIINLWPQTDLNGLYVNAHRIKGNLINLFSANGFYNFTDDKYVLSLHTNNTKYKDSFIQTQNAFFGNGKIELDNFEITKVNNLSISHVVSLGKNNYIVSNCYIAQKHLPINDHYFTGIMNTKNVIETSYKAKIVNAWGTNIYFYPQETLGTKIKGYARYIDTNDNDNIICEYFELNVSHKGELTTITLPTFLSVNWDDSASCVTIKRNNNYTIEMFIKCEIWTDFNNMLGIN